MSRFSIYPILMGMAVFVIFLTFALALCSGAPIPKGKSAPPRPTIDGSYTMNWHTTKYNTVFYSNGDYFCQTPGCFTSRWVGKWELVNDMIKITERREDLLTGEVGEYTDYKFTLIKNKLESVCGKFALRKCSD